ncbi:MAG: hypothetical protein ABJF10_09710 [Chthoniobacter sp.]|uniref:hypothetical protein n=1 Tax=Chthoniobacter sp. TaxID=2510640 RepID=UPI0032A2E997
MQLRRFLLVGAVMLAGAASWAADQRGAEQSKKVVSTHIVAPGNASTDGEAIGNVQVIYEDGTKDLWTTKGNCSLPKAAPDSTVGWTVHGNPVHINSGDPIRPNPELVVCRQGKVLARIQASLPFIEDWHFLAEGKQVALRCRGGHGPANIELHDTATGKLVTTLKAYDEKLPAWAKPLRDE